MSPLIVKTLGSLIGGVLKLLPFLAAYQAGKGAATSKITQKEVKRQEKAMRIEERNKKKTDAQILKELDEDTRDG